MCVREFEAELRRGVAQGKTPREVAHATSWELDARLLGRSTSGTTATFLWIDKDRATLGWIGDSAAIRVNMRREADDLVATRIHVPDCPKERALLDAVWRSRDEHEAMSAHAASLALEDRESEFFPAPTIAASLVKAESEPVLKYLAGPGTPTLQKKMYRGSSTDSMGTDDSSGRGSDHHRRGVLVDALRRGRRVDEAFEEAIQRRRANLGAWEPPPAASPEDDQGLKDDQAEPATRGRPTLQKIGDLTKASSGQKTVRRAKSCVGRRSHPRTGEPCGPLVVFSEYELDDGTEVKRIRGPSTQVTRSIGDWDAGRSLLPELDFLEWDIDRDDYDRVVIASDGLWDVVSHTEAKRIVKKRGRTPQQAADRLLKAALVASLKKGYKSFKDDTTIIVVDINHSDHAAVSTSWLKRLAVSSSY